MLGCCQIFLGLKGCREPQKVEKHCPRVQITIATATMMCVHVRERGVASVWHKRDKSSFVTSIKKVD